MQAAPVVKATLPMNKTLKFAAPAGLAQHNFSAAAVAGAMHTHGRHQSPSLRPLPVLGSSTGDDLVEMLRSRRDSKRTTPLRREHSLSVHKSTEAMGVRRPQVGMGSMFESV